MTSRSVEGELQSLLQSALSCVETQEKCKKLAKVIDSCGSVSLNSIFLKIIEDIFSTRITRWGLTRATHTPADSTCIREFLGPRGVFFRLIDRMHHHNVLTKCPLPSSATPQHLRTDYFNEFSEGTKSSYAFEAFFSHFASFITKANLLRNAEPFSLPSGYTHFRSFTTAAASPEESLYFVLLNDYLNHYFPTETNALLPMVSVAQQGSLKMATKSQCNITKASMLLRHDSTRHSNTQQSSRETRCCDVLTSIFCSFWLDGYGDSRPGDVEKSVLKSVPAENHVRAVRLVIKHVHFFCNSHLDHAFQQRFQNDSLMEQINHNIMVMLQPKLFQFLTHCFNAWPLDSGFRIVLETWLSYIQPWRYYRSSAGVETSIKPDSDVSNMWYNFVNLNVHFYTKLFQCVLKRFVRMDVSSSANSLLLFRVAKIYGQPNMINLIEQAEAEPGASSFQFSGNYESYLGLTQGASLMEHGTESSMFSAEFTNVVKQLLQVIAQAISSVKASDGVLRSGWSDHALNALGYGAFVDHNSGRQPQTPADRRKTEQNLTYAMKVFSEMYDLPLPRVSDIAHDSGIGTDADIADHVFDESGKMVLSPTGRRQLQNNQRKFPIVPNIDPELGPICSYENAFLVRALYTFCVRFNRRYGQKMEGACRKNNFTGKVSRHFFYHTSKAQNMPRGRQQKAYLTLRFMAHYRTIFYFSTLIIFSYLLGFSFLRCCFYLLCLYFIYLLVAVLWYEP